MRSKSRGKIVATVPLFTLFALLCSCTVVGGLAELISADTPLSTSAPPPLATTQAGTTSSTLHTPNTTGGVETTTRPDTSTTTTHATTTSTTTTTTTTTPTTSTTTAPTSTTAAPPQLPALDWIPSNDFPAGMGRAYGFSFIFGADIIVTGGFDVYNVVYDPVHDDVEVQTAAATSSLASDASSGGLWGISDTLTLPIPLWGTEFGVENAGSQLIVSSMATSIPFLDDPEGTVYVGDLSGSATGAPVTWKSYKLTQRPPFVSRRRAGMFATSDAVFFVGGIDINGKYLPEVLRLNLTTSKWTLDTNISNFGHTNRTVCECKILNAEACHVILSCGDCNGGPNNEYIIQEVLLGYYDYCSRTFSDSKDFPLPRPLVSYTATRVGQYLIALGTVAETSFFNDKDGSTAPLTPFRREQRQLIDCYHRQRHVVKATTKTQGDSMANATPSPPPLLCTSMKALSGIRFSTQDPLPLLLHRHSAVRLPHYLAAVQSTADKEQQASTNNNNTTTTTATPTTAPQPPAISHLVTVGIYYDLFSQHSFLYDNVELRPRIGGTLFASGSTAYYAGGLVAVPTPDAINQNYSELSTAVDMTSESVVPQIFANINQKHLRTFTVGESIQLTVGLCPIGSRLRLSASPTCNSPMPGVSDILLNGDAAERPLTNCHVEIADLPMAAMNAYICFSFGVCDFTLPYNQRPPCPGGSFYTFDDCKEAGCCFEGNTCSGYSVNGSSPTPDINIVQESKKTATTFFYLTEPALPVHILASSQTPSMNAFAQFFSSPTNIAIVALVVAVVAVGAVVFFGHRIIKKRRLAAGLDYLDGESDDQDGLLGGSGKYRILKKLGQGGFGSVFLVRRVRDGAELALKHIICQSGEERDYAVKEFELLYGAQGHPNMIRLEEMLLTWGVDNDVDTVTSASATTAKGSTIVANSKKGQDDATAAKKKKSSNLRSGAETPLLQVASRYVCIVMEYCPDGDLSHYISKVNKMRPLSEPMLLDVVCVQVCRLLQHLHTLSPPIVHRDLKPENLLLRNNYSEIVVTDFGLAQQLEKSYMTTRAGTLHFVAPECWKRHYTASVDMWALGCILYAAATARITASTARVMFTDAKRKTFRKDIEKDLMFFSPLFRNIVLGLLEVSPEKRLTAEGVLKVLDPSYVPPPRPSQSREEYTRSASTSNISKDSLNVN